MPTVHEASRALYQTECDLRDDGLEDKAEEFRQVKIQLYDLACDCRVRNGKLIEETVLNSKERKFLRQRYVRSTPWRRLFNSFGYSPDHCYRIHRDAVAKVARTHTDTDFKTLYERERARLEELLEQVGEKIT